MKFSHTRVVGWVINGFVGLASALLAMRVVLALFAANDGAAFVHWVYQMSAALLQPFRQVFWVSQPNDGHLLDFAALFAILVYVFVGYWLLAVLGSLKRR